MGYNTTVSGELNIIPPLTWTELKDSPYNPDADNYDDRTGLSLRVREETVDTNDGPLIRKTADALIADEEAFRAYTLIKDVQAAVDAFPTHTFIGVFECEGEDNPDMWRVVIRDGQAVKVEPQIIWPAGCDRAELHGQAVRMASEAGA